MWKIALTSFVIGVFFIGGFASAQEENLSTSSEETNFSSSSEEFELPLYGVVGEGSTTIEKTDKNYSKDLKNEFENILGFQERENQIFELYIKNLLSKKSRNSTVFEDDFNSYIDGDLNGQGGWSGNTAFDIQGIDTYEGAKAVEITGNPDASISKSGDEYAEGKTTYYHKRTGYSGDSDFYSLKNNAGQTVNTVRFRGNGFTDIMVWNGVGGAWVDIGDIIVNVYQQIEIEWDSSQNVRVSIDAGSWSNWYAPQNAGSPKTINLYLGGGGLGSEYLYIDHIAEEPFSPEEEMPTSTVLIENASTGAFFYLDKTISYGEALIVFLLLIQIIALLFQVIFNLEIPKRMNFKRH